MSSLGDIFLSSMHHFCGFLFRFDFKGRSLGGFLLFCFFRSFFGLIGRLLPSIDKSGDRRQKRPKSYDLDL